VTTRHEPLNVRPVRSDADGVRRSQSPEERASAGPDLAGETQHRDLCRVDFVRRSGNILAPMGRFFEARKQTIFARSARVSKLFTRIAREITMAVKAGGPDPEANPALRRAIQNARSASMPKDKIEGAIKRASDKDTSDYQEVIYEGYGPHGVAVVVVAATDNPTRTVANVRNCFNKKGGNMGTSGSVTFGFQRMGVFRIAPAEGLDTEHLELELIDAGLEEMGEGTTETGEPALVIRCALGDFGAMQDALDAKKLHVVESSTEFIAQTPTELGDEEAAEVLALVSLLEEDDDVQRVFHNLV
jgi:YebC/PmpR family DNA-binding regulatory protein